MQEPPPFKAIATSLKRGTVIPFLGAGVNFNMRSSPEDEWEYADDSKFLPTGGELSEYLATESAFPSTDKRDRSDLTKVSSYYVSRVGRDGLRDSLNSIFARVGYVPCGIHSYLASLDIPLLIVTTNYDELTERAFIEANRPFYVVSHLTDRPDWRASVLWWKYDPPQGIVLNTSRIEVQPQLSATPVAPIPPGELDRHMEFDRTIIYKMHGTADCQSFDWNSYVVTEDDYVEFLSRMTEKKAIPAMFIEHFSNKHFLFLGYGLNDWNFRIVLRDLFDTGRPRGRVSWAIQSNPTPFEIELWRDRGVRIFNMDIDRFADSL